jgi:iron(III) transport system ATP-binding protein
MFLNLSHLSVQYAGRTQSAVADVSFGLEAGQIGVLIGPSGCGKTTLLRAVAGLEPVSAGQISLGGSVVSTAQQSLAPEQRRVGMVFQDYALFPHLDVGQNIGFGIHHTSCLAANSSAWHWPVRWPPGRSCCCWTSRFLTWT